MTRGPNSIREGKEEWLYGKLVTVLQMFPKQQPQLVIKVNVLQELIRVFFVTTPYVLHC